MSTAEHNRALGLAIDEFDGHFSKFAEGLKDKFGIRVDLEQNLFANACESFIYDLERYNSFHEIEVPDRARRSAYLCKWIMRFRPVYVTSDIAILSEDDRRMALLANELYAMYLLSGILLVDLSEEISAELFNIVLYSLRYRAHSEDSFILFFASLCGL